MSISYINDYRGNLIAKNKARRIKDENGRYHYYEEGVSCILMKDGQWYRTTTGKIVYDWFIKEWIFASEFNGSVGLVEDGSIGSYSNADKEVIVFVKKDSFVKKTVFDPMSKNIESVGIVEKRWNKLYAMNENVAMQHGFVESILDGCFYKMEDCDANDLQKMQTPNIPTGERTNVYSLDDDKDFRSYLEDCYDKNNINVPKGLALFAKKYLPFTYGVEIEVQNGFVPRRIRDSLGFRTCRDGSLGDGQEYVSIPMQGGKGLEAIKTMCRELSKRCVISNKCSVHIHFGDVRRDKLYVVSLWKLFTMIQEELKRYFPFSRTNSIREDGKIYAALLNPLDLKTADLMKCKDEATFKQRVNEEFQKIYTFLNHGHPLGEVYDERFVKDTREQIINGKIEKQYCYRVKKFTYTTRLPRHAVQGRKWDRHERYLALNILNLFFSHSRTVEFRVHEATTNFDKIFNYLAINTAILKYAENFEKVLNGTKISIKDILNDHFPADIVANLLEYLQYRKSTFCASNDNFKTNWKTIEEAWYQGDKSYKTTKKIY